MAESSERDLTPDEAGNVAAARDKAFVLYEGVRTPHRKGTCGAIRAGEQVLGELLGDPSPIGGVTPALRSAVRWYQEAWHARMFAGQAARRSARTSPPTLRPSPPRRYVGSPRRGLRSRPSTQVEQHR
jgi:hypothetical protein